MRFSTREQLEARVAELEGIVAAKSTKALKKHVTPQPLKNFYSAYAVEKMFKQLLKIHDAEKYGEGSFGHFKVAGQSEPTDELAEELGQLIIVATSYLERIGCTEEHRALLFAELNRRNQEND